MKNTTIAEILKLEGKDFRSAYANYRRFLIEDYIAPNSTGAEIGVAWGDYSQLILDHGVTCLHLIDPWKSNHKYGRTAHWKGEGGEDWGQVYNKVVQRFQEEIDGGRAVMHRNTSRRALQAFSDESLDFVYIDGNHSYGRVREDLTGYYPKIKKGGVLLGDDYKSHTGVKQAVDDFIKTHDVEPLYVSSITAQFALRKK